MRQPPPPADKTAPIKLVAEPGGSHPLIDLFAGEEKPDFANGGPEGAGFVVALAAVAVIVAFAIAADQLSDGAVCDALGWQHGDKPAKDSGYTDPDAVSGTRPTPAEMVASLLEQAGVKGIDPTSVEMTDILGRLSDTMGKVADLMNSMTNAAQSGDTGLFDSALSALMTLAGLDAFGFGLAAPSPQDFTDAVFQAFGIEGGMDGAASHAALQHAEHMAMLAEATQETPTLPVVWGDDFG